MTKMRDALVVAAGFAVLVAVGLGSCGEAAREPAAGRSGRWSQAQIDAGAVELATLVERGRALFFHRWTRAEGFGDAQNLPVDGPAPFVHLDRIGGPESSSCQDCHGSGNFIVAGPGDGAANAFVKFRPDDPRSVVRANQRNPQPIHGRAWMELLAEEMTRDLERIRDRARREAAESGAAVTLPLVTRGDVSFGKITARPEGAGGVTCDTSAVEGVSPDLAVRPFSWKGSSPTLRRFTIEALDRHHGIQARELVVLRGADPGEDLDGDGVRDELSAGDVTALVVFQALLPAPVEVLPDDLAARAAALRGKAIFRAIGCADCHVPELELEKATLRLPSPLGPERALELDLATRGAAPRLPRGVEGRVRVPLYSDLKRHRMGKLLDDPNPQEVEDAPLMVAAEEFMTPPLWGVASSGPWLHHGRAVSLEDAILAHGGEAAESRARFTAMAFADRHAILEFLGTLRLPGDRGPITPKPTLWQSAIDAGKLSLEEISAHGEDLWLRAWTRDEGYGDNDDTSDPTADNQPPLAGFNRVRGPDANNCQSCHGGGTLVLGGSGGNAMNVVININMVDTLEVIGADERNTPPIHGLAWLEILGQEMTADLRRQRDAALAKARQRGEIVEASLRSKGVYFGRLRVHPEGPHGAWVDYDGLQGVTSQLFVRPFHAKGVLATIRDFTYLSMFRHTGVESNDFVRDQVTAAADAHFDRDEDGVIDEATFGDVTALTVFQARFPVPIQVWPTDPSTLERAKRGEKLFAEVGCADCHLPHLVAESSIYRIPSPFDPERALSIDLTSTDVSAPRLHREADGTVRVPLFGDLKLHDLGPELADNIIQKLHFPHVPDPPVPVELFLTTELWGCADTAPYMHHGRCTTLSEAIEAHGGEAARSRRAWRKLPEDGRQAILDFLGTLRLTPDRDQLPPEIEIR